MCVSQQLKIEVTGWDGSEWVISGPGYGAEGVTLKPQVSQLFDTPVKTLYVPGPFGEEYAGKRVQRREMVFTVQVGSVDMTPEEWAEVDAAWRWAWDFDKESTLTVTTYTLDEDGDPVPESRYLKVRMLEEPKAYGDQDPYLTGDNSVVMTVTATFPYWRGADRVYEWSTTSAAANTTLSIANDGDVAVWPRWALSAPGRWTLPDFSWGNDQYSRGAADAQRVVGLPALPANAHASVDSDPRVQTIICQNGYPAQQHWRGKDLLYPVMPGAAGGVPLAVTNATGGAAAQLRIPRWYSRPWSRPVAL